MGHLRTLLVGYLLVDSTTFLELLPDIWLDDVPLVHGKTVCAKTRIKRIVKTPMATPISTSSVPIAPSLARGRTRCRCRKIEWVTGLDAVRWCTAPARANPKRVMADLRKTATTDKRAMADKISRRNLLAQSKGQIKSAEGLPRRPHRCRAVSKLRLTSIFIVRERNPSQLFMPGPPKSDTYAAGSVSRGGFCVRHRF